MNDINDTDDVRTYCNIDLNDIRIQTTSLNGDNGLLLTHMPTGVVVWGFVEEGVSVIRLRPKLLSMLDEKVCKYLEDEGE